MPIADNIKLLREKFGLTQKELAEIAGVTNKAVSTWEIGASEPRMGVIQKIADHFGLQKSNLIEDGGMQNIVAAIKSNPPENPEKKITGYTLNYGGGGQTIELTEKEYKQLLGMLDVIRREQGSQN